MTRTTVIVVDDHDLLLEEVSGCLARFDDLEVIGEAGSGEAARPWSPTSSPTWWSSTS